MAANPNNPHAVYRCFAADGRLLYIGCSMGAMARIEAHAGHKSWALAISSVTMEWHPDKASARAAETAAIVAELPEWNVHHRIFPKHSIGTLHHKFKRHDPSTWEAKPARYPLGHRGEGLLR